MGITIHYQMVVKESDIDAPIQRMALEATRRGMETISMGDVKAWDEDEGRGIIISPDEGSEPFSLVFAPYSKELKDELMKKGTHYSEPMPPSKDVLSRIRDYHLVDMPYVEVYNSFSEKREKGLVLEDRESGRSFVAFLKNGKIATAMEFNTWELQKRGSLGTHKVYRYFYPYFESEVMDAFQPGTAFLMGPRFTKTQFANDALKTHVGVIELLDILKSDYAVAMNVVDEGEYWEKRDIGVLGTNMGTLASMIRNFGDRLQVAAEKRGSDLQVKIGEAIPTSEPAPEPLVKGFTKGTKPAQKTLKDFTKRREVHVRAHKRRV